MSAQPTAPPEDTATVLSFPPRSCVKCVHFDLIEDSVGVSSQCKKWDEPLDTETVGATCPDYQPE